MPEAVHAPECSIVRGEEVRPVSEYGEEEAAGNAVAEEGSDAGPWRGEAFDEGEDGLGQGEPVPVVVGRVDGGGEPISQRSDHLERVGRGGFRVQSGHAREVSSG